MSRLSSGLCSDQSPNTVSTGHWKRVICAFPGRSLPGMTFCDVGHSRAGMATALGNLLEDLVSHLASCFHPGIYYFFFFLYCSAYRPSIPPSTLPFSLSSFLPPPFCFSSCPWCRATPGPIFKWRILSLLCLLSVEMVAEGKSTEFCCMLWF